MDGLNFPVPVSEESLDLATVISAAAVDENTNKLNGSHNSPVPLESTGEYRHWNGNLTNGVSILSGENDSLNTLTGNIMYSDGKQGVVRDDILLHRELGHNIAETHTSPLQLGIKEKNELFKERNRMKQRRTKNNGITKVISLPPPFLAEFQPSSPTVEFLENSHDEFDDFTINTLRTCCYKDNRRSSDISTNSINISSNSIRYVGSDFPMFNYAEPTVNGSITSVFKNGLLYKIVTHDGAWHFFNDTMKYEMIVKFIFSSSCKLIPGPKTTLKLLASGEYEACLVLMPGDTEEFIVGEINGYKNISKAREVRADFKNIHVEEHNEVILSQLHHIANEIGKPIKELTEKEVLDACKRTKNSSGFIDPIFSPCYTSLYRPNVDNIFLPALPWRRPQAYIPISENNECRLFRGRIMPHDVQLGSGGDAYFISAMAILAEFPMKVRELFRHPFCIQDGKIERQQHAYRVMIGHNGWWKSVLIDDYIPASLQGPEFARCERDLRKLWVSLLQKAYAKLYGSYAAIQCGDTLETLQDFLGFPAYRFDEEWSEACKYGPLSSMSRSLFLTIESHYYSGHIVCLSTPDEASSQATLQKFGLHYGMSYYIMDVLRHGQRRLIKLRCPNANTAVNNNNNNNNNNIFAQNVNSHKQEEEEDEKALWMDWSEALQIFDGGGVCATQFSYKDYRVRGSFNGCIPIVVLRIDVRVTLNAYCVLSQPDNRGSVNNDGIAPLHPLMLCVTLSDARHKGPQYFDVCTTTVPDLTTMEQEFIVARDIALHYNFDPICSPYYIIPRVYRNTGILPYTIGLLTSRNIDNDAVRVNFVQLSNELPEILETIPVLDTLPVETDYQIRGRTGVVKEKRGTSIYNDVSSTDGEN